MDLSNYLARKAKGAIQIAKVMDGYAVASKRYDQNTSEYLDTEISPLSRPWVEQQRVIMAANLENLDAIVADLDALDAEAADA